MNKLHLGSWRCGGSGVWLAATYSWRKLESVRYSLCPFIKMALNHRNWLKMLICFETTTLKMWHNLISVTSWCLLENQHNKIISQKQFTMPNSCIAVAHGVIVSTNWPILFIYFIMLHFKMSNTLVSMNETGKLFGSELLTGRSRHLWRQQFK